MPAKRPVDASALAQEKEDARALGLPEGWRVRTYVSGSSRQRKFISPESDLYDTLAKLKDALGYLPEELKPAKGRGSAEDAAVVAQEQEEARTLGLPEGWRVRTYVFGANRTRKFISPESVWYDTFAKLQDALGYLPEGLNQAKAKRARPAAPPVDPAVLAQEQEDARALGLPKGWRVKTYQSGSSRQRRFISPEGVSHDTLSKLKDALGHLPEELSNPGKGKGKRVVAAPPAADCPASTAPKAVPCEQAKQSPRQEGRRKRSTEGRAKDHVRRKKERKKEKRKREGQAKAGVATERRPEKSSRHEIGDATSLEFLLGAADISSTGAVTAASRCRSSSSSSSSGSSASDKADDATASKDVQADAKQQAPTQQPPPTLEPLPTGWEQHWSAEHNLYFYWNTSTGESAWERPSA